jgi:two-component system sensor histidine kinase KdpD
LFRSQRHQATIPGSGLGFWIASIFVAANGGRLEISSEGPGMGATATITLPSSSMTHAKPTVSSHE